MRLHKLATFMDPRSVKSRVGCRGTPGTSPGTTEGYMDIICKRGR